MKRGKIEVKERLFFLLSNIKLLTFFCVFLSFNLSSQIFYQKETVIFIADNTTVADVIIIHNEKQEESVLPQISISKQTTVVGLEQNSNAKIVYSNRYEKNKKSFEKNKASTNLKETPLITKNNTYSKNVTFKKDSSHSFFNSERPFQTVSPSSNHQKKIIFSLTEIYARTSFFDTMHNGLNTSHKSPIPETDKHSFSIRPPP